MSSGERIWVVDRIEGDIVTLVEDGSGETVEVARALFSPAPTEGAVLRVPLVDGRPDWASALVDEELRQERLSAARDALDELRKRDPGGDVVL